MPNVTFEGVQESANEYKEAGALLHHFLLTTALYARLLKINLALRDSSDIVFIIFC